MLRIVDFSHVHAATTPETTQIIHRKILIDEQMEMNRTGVGVKLSGPYVPKGLTIKIIGNFILSRAVLPHILCFNLQLTRNAMIKGVPELTQTPLSEILTNNRQTIGITAGHKLLVLNQTMINLPILEITGRKRQGDKTTEFVTGIFSSTAYLGTRGGAKVVSYTGANMFRRSHFTRPAREVIGASLFTAPVKPGAENRLY